MEGIIICPNFKQSSLIRTLIRYLCFDYFGCKTWASSFTLISASLQKSPVL